MLFTFKLLNSLTQAVKLLNKLNLLNLKASYDIKYISIIKTVLNVLVCILLSDSFSQLDREQFAN